MRIKQICKQNTKLLLTNNVIEDEEDDDDLVACPKTSGPLTMEMNTKDFFYRVSRSPPKVPFVMLISMDYEFYH